MDTTTAKASSRKINREIFSLNPSALIMLFEIDISDIAFDLGLIDEIVGSTNTIFRFHNNVKLGNSNIYWQGNNYIAAPIKSDGFEFNGRGVLPTPKLSITVDDTNLSIIGTFKDKISELGDLVGAKVTRIRTFAKYLDNKNFLDEVTPDGFEPDPNAEFPRDIYYIDRKSNENKFAMEFELGSVLDVEGLRLPGRTVLRNKCTHTYRGPGCFYEDSARRNEDVHGKATESTLPFKAPPVANDKDELIKDIVQTAIVDRGEYEPNRLYSKGDSVYFEKNGIKHYFVAKADNPPVGPPNLSYWVADQCSKLFGGCRLRHGFIGNGYLPIGAFPGVNKFN